MPICPEIATFISTKTTKKLGETKYLGYPVSVYRNKGTFHPFLRVNFVSKQFKLHQKLYKYHIALKLKILTI